MYERLKMRRGFTSARREDMGCFGSRQSQFEFEPKSIINRSTRCIFCITLISNSIHIRCNDIDILLGSRIRNLKGKIVGSKIVTHVTSK